VDREDTNRLNWLYALDRGRYGALKDVLRMPVAHPVVIVVRGFERGAGDGSFRKLVVMMLGMA